MKRLCLLLSALALSTIFAQGTVFANSADTTVVGVVMRVEPTMIEVVTDSGDTKQVAVDPSTSYMKWVLEKPWAQDPKVDESFLRTGQRVHIRLRQDDPSSARKVWIVV
jgi:hypothetical protein